MRFSINHASKAFTLKQGREFGGGSKNYEGIPCVCERLLTPERL